MDAASSGMDIGELIQTLMSIKCNATDAVVRLNAAHFLDLVRSGEEAPGLPHFLANYGPQPRPRRSEESPKDTRPRKTDKRYKKGWRAINIKWARRRTTLHDQLQVLKARNDIPDQVRQRLEAILGSVVDGRLKSETFVEAVRIVHEHQSTKRVLKRRLAESSRDSHALSYACQTCENLSDVTPAIVAGKERKQLIIRLGESAMILLKLQQSLMKGDSHD